MFGFFKVKTKRLIPRRNRRSYLLYKEQARELVTRRLAYFNQFYNYPYKRISIRSQKTRWGSCSKQGNLNFNYRIVLLPPHLADYIVVHELCHIGEFNHSQDFWNLVAQTLPDYVSLQTELKNCR